MIASNAFGMPTSGWIDVSRSNDLTMGMRDTCAVHLFDRRTGCAHRINGRPLVIFSRSPDEAAAALLEGRDPAVWEARVEHIAKETR